MQYTTGSKHRPQTAMEKAKRSHNGGMEGNTDRAPLRVKVYKQGYLGKMQFKKENTFLKLQFFRNHQFISNGKSSTASMAMNRVLASKRVSNGFAVKSLGVLCLGGIGGNFQTSKWLDANEVGIRVIPLWIYQLLIFSNC